MLKNLFIYLNEISNISYFVRGAVLFVLGCALVVLVNMAEAESVPWLRVVQSDRRMLWFYGFLVLNMGLGLVGASAFGTLFFLRNPAEKKNEAYGVGAEGNAHATGDFDDGDKH